MSSINVYNHIMALGIIRSFFHGSRPPNSLFLAAFYDVALRICEVKMMIKKLIKISIVLPCYAE